MAQKNRKRYQRKLDVGSLVALFLLAAACAGAGCGFVKVKNAHVDCADLKRSLEQEIRGLEKELETVSTRIRTSYDRTALAAILAEKGSELQPIRISDTVSGMASEIPAGLAVAGGVDVGMTFINVENPSG